MRSRVRGRRRWALWGLCLAAGLLLSGSAGAQEGDDPLLFTFFKSVISTADGERCSHVPSCSRYAKEAVERHGAVKGFVLTCDRLIRCGGDDRELLPQVVVEGKRVAWDPVSANDFWWGASDGPAKDQLFEKMAK